MAIYLKDVGYIKGPGVNSHWSVPAGLEDLQGLMKGAMLLLEELDRHVVRRDKGERPLPYIIGLAQSAIMVTSYAAEIAFKTLIAQTNPIQKPPKWHDLLRLFDRLDLGTQAKVQNTFITMTPLGGPNWINTNEKIRQTIVIGRENFVEWRYRAEKKSVSNGIPKGLINVAEAVKIVTLNLVISAEVAVVQENK